MTFTSYLETQLGTAKIDILVVFGHYNIMLGAKLANAVDNAMNSHGQAGFQTTFWLK